MPLKTLLGLILGNLIWSLHPAMGKLVLADFTPAQGAWLRYTSALLAFVALRAAIPRSVFPALKAEPIFFARSRREWATVLFVGGMTFCFSPLLQLTGLNASRATDNALIVAMEPLMTVLLAWILLRESVTLLYALTFGLALVGFALVAGISPAGLTVSRASMFGDLLILASLLGEAVYSVGSRKLVEKHSPISIFGIAIFSGVIFLTIAVYVMSGQGPVGLIQIAAHQMTWKSALALAWLGPMGTTASYLYWMYALKEAPIASVALTLFIQPVFGAFWGYLFLGERLGFCQSLGGMLIIIAVFAQTLSSIRRARLGRRTVEA